MLSQGYPLKINSDGQEYWVVGWKEVTADTYLPIVVPLALTPRTIPSARMLERGAEFSVVTR